MKIISVKFFQGAKIGTATVASIQDSSVIQFKESNHKVSIEESASGIEVKYGNRSTLIPWNNVQYVEKEEVVVKKTLDEALKRGKDK